MANKVKITDQNSVQVFPITHVSAVIDNNGNPVDQILDAQTDLINQKQLEIGAVQSDLTPTSGSSHWVTSGGVYNAIENVGARVNEDAYADLDIADITGNVLARFSGGHIKVKNFDSSKVNFETGDDAYADLDIADENGFVLARFVRGHVMTKMFNSELFGYGFGNHWKGKIWFAYGTSLTNTNNEGKYAAYVEQYSGMLRTNKGISGGALVANRNIYNAVTNVTDGKTEADLITLECLANDASSPFGTVEDTDNTTFLGSLGLCIKYLQENTTAQIVVIPSMRGRRNAAGTEQFYPYNDEDYTDKCQQMAKLCLMYGVYCINPNNALGYYRKTDAYYVDNIHHTSLGGKVFADYIWSKLKEIPLWTTSL